MDHNNPSKDRCKCRDCRCEAPKTVWQQRRSTPFNPFGPAANKTALRLKTVKEIDPTAYVCGYIVFHKADSSITVIDRSMLRHFSSQQMFKVMHE
jgi:hypothetical protein